jgi:hypothetical protein
MRVIESAAFLIALCLLGCSAGGPVPGDGGTQRTCGGIAGIACPGFGLCVDDPSDSCDPKAGGADCGGVCSCTDTVACKRGTHFDANPDVCSCVADMSAP